MNKTPDVTTYTNAALIPFSMAGNGFSTSRYSSTFGLAPHRPPAKFYTGISTVTVPHSPTAWRCFCWFVCIFPLPIPRLWAVLPAAF